MTHALGWAATGRAGIVHSTSGTTSASGALTVAIPAGLMTSIIGLTATAVRDTVDPTKACFAQVRSYTAPTATVAGAVVIQVFESRTIVLGGGDGLEATTTATLVLVTVFGQ